MTKNLKFYIELTNGRNRLRPSYSKSVCGFPKKIRIIFGGDHRRRPITKRNRKIDSFPTRKPINDVDGAAENSRKTDVAVRSRGLGTDSRRVSGETAAKRNETSLSRFDDDDDDDDGRRRTDRLCGPRGIKLRPALRRGAGESRGKPRRVGFGSVSIPPAPARQ